jgi:pyruvate,water dikinase
LPCCAGRVEGIARLLEEPEPGALQPGEILVAERTDPGWVFVFPHAAGILVEHGSPLSHAAIAARELGVPAIVNIPGLTHLVRTGDRLAMDGSTGRVEILKDDQA